MMVTLDDVFGLLAPHMCIACGVEGAVLCLECLKSAGQPIPSRCAGCRMLTKNFQTCNACRRWLHAKAVFVATSYEGIEEALLHRYKFDVARQAVRPLARMMSDALIINNIEYDLVVGIPTAPARVRARGFDNGKLLAQTVARNLNLPYRHFLRRHTNKRQLGATRAQRITQMREEFYAISGANLKGKTVLLVDDVITTGATIAAATVALKAAGAKQVYVLVYAQKA